MGLVRTWRVDVFDELPRSRPNVGNPGHLSGGGPPVPEFIAIVWVYRGEVGDAVVDGGGVSVRIEGSGSGVVEAGDGGVVQVLFKVVGGA